MRRNGGRSSDIQGDHRMPGDASRPLGTGAEPTNRSPASFGVKVAEGRKPLRRGSHEELAAFDSTADFGSAEDEAGFDSVVVVAGAAATAVAAGSASVDGAAGTVASLVPPRLSVMYQPAPLKTIPTGWMTRFTVPSQDRHSVSGSSENF